MAHALCKAGSGRPSGVCLNLAEASMTTGTVTKVLGSSIGKLGKTLLLFGGVALLACNGGGSEDDDPTRNIGRYTEQMLHEGGRGVGFATAEEGTLARALGGTSSSVDSVTPAATSMGASIMPLPAPMGQTGMSAATFRAMTGSSLTRKLTAAATAMPSMMTAEEQFDEIGAELRRLFDERLFVEANYEGRLPGGGATYLLRPDPTCRPLPGDDDPPGTVPEIDADCADDLGRLEVRLAARHDGDGARVTVQVGPDRLELIVFVVHSDLLALELDLPKAKAATDYIRVQLGDGAPTGSFERLAGKLGASLKKVGDGKVTVAVSILQALDIAESTESVELRSAAADPLLAITGDGVTKHAVLTLGLGATEVVGTWNPQSLNNVVNRDLVVSLGGLYGTFDLDENAKRIGLTDVGIGQTRVVVRGMTVFDLNLNASAMRRFSGSITVNSDDTPHIEVVPRFDLGLALDYASIAGDFSTPPDPAVLHDTYGVLLEAPGQPAAIFDGVASTATFPGGLKVVAGTLTFSAASVPAETVAVPAGRCLISRSPVPAGANPFLGSLQVVDCP
jgi:hypothetical protein